MKRIEAALRRIISDLREFGYSFALLGGFAVSARTEPRTTRDVDVAVLVSDDSGAQRLAFQLSQRGYSLDATIEQERTGRLATIRTTSPTGTVVDLLFASSGVEAELISAATTLEILDGLRVPVATIGHLIATKVLSRDDRNRPQDRLDLHALFRAASDADLETARHSLQLVQSHGYHRGRALLADLDRAHRELAPER